MSPSGSGDGVGRGVVVPCVAAVGWALLSMAAVAALGLHLLGADAVGALGPMTAATVVLAVGGSVSPSGEVSAFGLDAGTARTGLDLTPLGVGLVGALVLGWFFVRSLRLCGAGRTVGGLLLRAGVLSGVLLLTLCGLAWAGRDVVTFDGAELAAGGGPGELGVPGLEDLGGIGDFAGALPGQVADLVEAKASVGFAVDLGASLVGATLWVFTVLTIAVLASRRTSLPPRWSALDRWARPAVSALVTVALVAVLAGLAAALYAAAGDEHPGRVLGAALLGAPNGAWLGLALGLLVPWDVRASGELLGVLPDPIGGLLSVSTGEPVTIGRLAELDARVWLLPVAVALLMVTAGLLTGVRMPGGGVARRVARCALALGVTNAVLVALMVWLTGVRADAALSVLGLDTVGAGLELSGDLGAAVLLGGAWGAAAGVVGGLLPVRGGAGPAPVPAGPEARGAEPPGPYAQPSGYGQACGEPNPYRDQPPGSKDRRGGDGPPTVPPSAPPGPGVPPRW
ncbi:streptophobe family protein [Streptomyces sp. NPDC006879]|uniref:streptophobe family protein n=1 Tax=Streptomyces sp. NPDC006879 TaxID=3364767 RepID=UPI0036D09C8D